MDVFIRKVADKKLRSLTPKLEQSIREAISKIAEDPERTDLDIRPLSGQPGYRLRVGGWRVLYVLDETGLTVKVVASRGSAYKP